MCVLGSRRLSCGRPPAASRAADAERPRRTFRDNFRGLWTEPAQPYQTGGSLLYFGGYSPHALDLWVRNCDVCLMWPEPKEQIAERMRAVKARAVEYGRTLDYGLRVHIVRETEAEAEAKEYAESLTSRLDDEYGRLIRERAYDASSLGVRHQARARARADRFGYVEPHLWTGLGRARSGCGAALVGSTDQVMSEIEEYRRMGLRAFIFSGCPHPDEARSFGLRMLPNLATCSLPQVCGRGPTNPPRPLGVRERR